jgi:predicted transcriptional regulator
MADLTEQTMADSFGEALITSRVKGLPSFKTVFREFECYQGVADFVALSDRCQQNVEDLAFVASMSLRSLSAVLALLKPHAPRTEAYLAETSGLSQGTVRRILGDLETAGLVSRNVRGSAALGPNWVPPSLDIWAFELKLGNWHRALFQCLQYKAFAHQVVVVMPPVKEALLQEHSEAFRASGVGAMTFDPSVGSLRVVIPPLSSRPSSRHHTIFALQRIQALRNGG